MRTDLMPMDIVTHDDKLWVVTTAHLRCWKWQINEEHDCERRKELKCDCLSQAVNLCLHGKDNVDENRKEKVPMCECKIVKDMEERAYVGDSDFAFFPDNDFKEIKP